MAVELHKVPEGEGENMCKNGKAAMEKNEAAEEQGLMYKTIQIHIVKGEEGWYVAEAVHLPVVSQGRTVDETMAKIREALALHLEGEDIEELGFYPESPVVITIEMDPVYA